ncbi:hypothetical protein LTR53_003370 [Teratosphaeriaceae sp. CCFEE 6253]|nr:hypothetical protein LTR53_003370 [Teratosphaeriaceae sp. CCFEE 6253]
MSAASGPLWNALIRTHHITSRKKVAKLKQAASAHAVFVLLRSGSSPGIMYAQGSRAGVESWVRPAQSGEFIAKPDLVKKLRYKDYQLASRPAPIMPENAADTPSGLTHHIGLHETDSVKDFGQQMADRGVHAWWRRGMGYTSQDSP